MKLMTWTLHKPSNLEFGKYAKLKNGEQWYSDKFDIIDENAINTWDYRRRSFHQMLEKNTSKFYAIGLHEFGVNINGEICSTTVSNNTQNDYVLNSTQTDIERPCALSLRYYMHKYPEIKWSLQFLVTKEERNEAILDNKNGAQDTFIKQCKKIMEIYCSHYPNLKGVEIDMEKTTTRTNVNGKHESEVFRDLLVRIKNEVCIPLGLELRVNLFAMTGDKNPSYYAWHDYRTVASGRDKNGKQAIDEFQLMTYDFSWGGSAPGPSTPLWWLKQALDHVANVLPPEKTFIGNAGYGRRWPLGEYNINADGTLDTNSLRMGGTLDFKQLMQVQNGLYIHNCGKTIDGVFKFNNQDFIPFGGFNDPESDYISTYMNVYDKFSMKTNGGADIKSMNRGQDYVTRYSRGQKATATGVSLFMKECSEKSKTNVQEKSMDPLYFNGDMIVSKGYNVKYPDVINKPEDVPFVKYNFSGSGTKRLVLLVSFPFYNYNSFDIKLNGVVKNVNLGEEWNPYLQKIHFKDMGTVNLNGSNTIEINDTKGCSIYGVVLCDTYSDNLKGESMKLPTYIIPFKNRGNTNNGYSEVKNAQFPSDFRIVAELIRRPPRPSIMWEDMFGSYLDKENPDRVKWDDVTKGIARAYYPDSSNGGKSVGVWDIMLANENNSYAYCKSSTPNSLLCVDHKYKSNAMVDIETACEGAYDSYGVRILKDASNGYTVLFNFNSKKIELYKLTNGSQTLLTSSSFSLSHTARSNFKIYVLNGKLTVAIRDVIKIKEYTIDNVPYYYGIYNNKGTVRTYKYGIATLDRWETLEKTKVKIDGQEINHGNVDRNCTKDKYDFLVFTGYPYDLKGAFPNNNITNTEVNPHDWNLDYRNVPLCNYKSWQGEKIIEIESIDAGIWYKTFYVGDSEGMSVAYNSDRVGFVKTVNFVNDYKCKGVAMWTLGQEDTTIYSFLP